MRGRRWWLAPVLAAALARAEVGTEAVGTIVREIRFEGARSIDRGDYLRQLPLRVGEPLSSEAVEQSIEWLRRKAIFRSLSADATAVEQGTRVTFRLEPTPFVVGLETSGAVAIDEETLLRRARIREDEPMSPDKAAAAERRVIALYEERGYPHAKATLDTVEERPGEVRALLRVEEGEPLRIDEVRLTGIPPDWEAGARAALPFSAGSVAARDTLAGGRSALLRFARGRGYYQAEVSAAQEITGQRVTLRYQCRLGQRFEISVSGNRRISSAELLGLTDLASRPIVTRGTWQLMAIRMQERYQEEGFRFAEVRVETGAGEPRRISFAVTEGPQVRVREVRLRGVRALDEAALRGMLRTRPGKRPWLMRFVRSSGPPPDALREQQLADDLELIRARYREIGYLHADVREADRLYSEDRQWATVTLEVSEGRRSVVATLSVEGVDESPEELRSGLLLRPGAPLRPDALEGDRRLLRSRLGALGFVDAEVTAVVTPGTPAAEVEPVDVRYRVEPGPRVRVGRVWIQQNYFTRDSVIRRALPFSSGDVLDPEKLSAGQTEIYRLGLFRSVSVQPEQQPGEVRDVTVQVGERPGGELLYGIGYDTRAGVHNFLQIGHRNLGGGGDQLSVRGDLNLAPSDLVPDEYIVALSGKHPHVLASPYGLAASVARQQSERSIDEFSIRRTSVSSGFEREFRRGLRATLRFEFEDSDIYDVHPDVVLTGKDIGKLRTVSLNPIVVYDGRDDAFAPTRGVFDSLRLRYGTTALGSDVHFFKAVVQHSRYVPLSDDLTWIYAARVGFAEPLGESTDIPLSERFFLGGRTTVRGYEENSIGPRGADGNPVGGDLLLNFNTELRFPLLYGLGGAVFVDGGGLYLHDRAVSIGDFRESAGTGLRYRTPVGAISLDYGFKVRRRRDESIGEIHFTIGNIF